MASDLECDVLVVGAGPSGSVTAKFAAQNGANVLMIEKRQEIGSPVRCGEGISKAWLPEVGITPSPQWINVEVEGARIFSPSEKVFEVNERDAGNEVGYVIERDAFDKALAIDAGNAGAEIMLKTHAVNVLKENGRIAGVKAKQYGQEFNIHAKITIGADGFESQVGRWAGLPTNLQVKDMDSCLQYRMTNIDSDERYCDFYLGECAPGGYVWIFPKGDHLANVGIGVQVSKIKSQAEVKALLDKWIDRHPGYAKGKKIDMVAGAVSISPPIKQAVTDGMMLVGDAARMIDPITGGGIANGCIAGKVAGEVAAKAVKEGNYSKDRLMEYERGWRAKIEEKQYRNWLAKEKLVTLPDEVFDKVIDSLQGQSVEKLNVLNILKLVKEKHPELTKEFADFL
ncbi:MAG: NAD(P)/FAD-dependent oxidoreductase [Candidatus Thermoplasmatota archaeon]|jgi:digeranylgeranylglycerophospholipid reductase|nr:NAD(P)/FAD-dependent oxidoreductase [Candidatus Thermoplasmatota archaeon]